MTRRVPASVLIFLATWIPYLVIGVYLVSEVHLFFGDALSRVQSAQSVLFSRTPHLAAIGFIFTPLTAIVQLPLTALTPWFPEMTTQALSAVIMSSAFMAGSVVQASGIARDQGLRPLVAGTFTIFYAINPMIVLYAANGMSEAPYLFFLAWATRRLIRWVSSDDVHELVVSLGYRCGRTTRRVRGRDEAAATPAVWRGGDLVAAPLLKSHPRIAARPLRTIDDFRALLYTH